MTNDAAVAEIRNKFGDPEAFAERELVVTGDIQILPIGTTLVPATTVAELRDNAAKWKSLHDAMVLVHDVQERRIGRMTAQLEAAERRVAELERVCAEAYQVVGVLLSDTDQFDTDHGEKILDNLSEARIVHEDVLPWESKDARHG